MIVGVRHCFDHQQPKELRDCNRRRCFNYKWEELDKWTDCSEICGNGTKSKLTICKNVTYDDREIRVENKHCNESERPRVSQICNNGACITYKWILTDEWTDCSALCGDGGTSSRISVCQQTFEDEMKIVNDSLCNNEEKETHVISCNRKPCFIFEWQIGEWSSCPSDCASENNTLTRRRNITCIQKFLSGLTEQTDLIFCDDKVKPAEEEPCEMPPCLIYRWNVSNIWSDCSVTCGNSGIQTQLLQCIENNGSEANRVVDASYCFNTSLKKEPESRGCNLLPCITYR